MELWDALPRPFFVLNLLVNFNENIAKYICIIPNGVSDKLCLVQITLELNFAKLGILMRQIVKARLDNSNQHRRLR